MWKLKMFYLFQGTFIFELLKKIIFQRWEKAGCPIPPPYTIKREEIKRVAHEYNCQIFVETGTFLGATTNEMIKHFKKLYTIELSDKLFEQAHSKFLKYKHVKVIHGDSGKMLFNVIPEIDSTTLFWLDGHYSGGITALGESACPIYKELEAIFQLRNIDYVLMIDDARCFGNKSDPDYPSVEDLTNFVTKNSPIKMALDIRLDIIIVKPLI